MLRVNRFDTDLTCLFPLFYWNGLLFYLYSNFKLINFVYLCYTTISLDCFDVLCICVRQLFFFVLFFSFVICLALRLRDTNLTILKLVNQQFSLSLDHLLKVWQWHIYELVQWVQLHATRCCSLFCRLVHYRILCSP